MIASLVGAPAPAGSSGYITETILQNIRVLAIDQTIQEDEQGRKTKVGTTATLELTPQQAQILTVAQQMSDRLTLALRSLADSQVKPSDAEADALHLIAGADKTGVVKVVRDGVVTEQTSIR